VVVRLAVLSVRHGGYADFPFGLVTASVISIPASIWFIQQAHASGPPDIVVAALTLADPMIAVGIGYVVLGEGAKTYAFATIGEVACFAVSAAGIITLSRLRRRSTPLPSAEPNSAFRAGEPS
jgi:hypothetical protein